MVIVGVLVLSIVVLGLLAGAVGMAAGSLRRRHVPLIAWLVLAAGTGAALGASGTVLFPTLDGNRVFEFEGRVSGMNADRTSFCITPTGGSSGDQVCAPPIDEADVGAFEVGDAVTAGFAEFTPPDPAVGRTVLLFVTANSSS